MYPFVGIFLKLIINWLLFLVLNIQILLIHRRCKSCFSNLLFLLYFIRLLIDNWRIWKICAAIRWIASWSWTHLIRINLNLFYIQLFWLINLLWIIIVSLFNKIFTDTINTQWTIWIRIVRLIWYVNIDSHSSTWYILYILAF